jgi:hypothetical protein
MRFRHIALGCTLTGALGCLVLPPVTAHAATKPTPTLTISAPVRDHAYGARVKFTITLGPTARDRKVTLYASPYGSRTRKRVATGTVNAEGNWFPTYTITKKTLFTVVFGGDSANAPNSSNIMLQAFARAADRVAGFFKTTKISGVTYEVFHGNSTLTLYSTVTPAKHGQCLQPESQQFDNGFGWDADTKYGCDKLDAASHDAAPFTLNLAVGDRYRIRGDYSHSAADLGNLSVQAPWVYFEVVKLGAGLQVLGDEGAGRLGQFLQQGLTAAGRHVPQDVRHGGRGRVAE